MTHILDTIQSPSDVKRLDNKELEQLAQEIRQVLIQVCAVNGGHIGPNLGVVELTVALHYVFNTPSDQLVFDVSHQAYVHKMLTGRRDRIHTIRQPDGLNGFMLRTESDHDCYGAGHAGTALSAALGMATARDLRGGKEHVVALCGDAAFTCGITYEAMNNASSHAKRLLVILNDNEWSIDKNVGAIATYFNKIVTSDRYAYLHDQAHRFIERLGGKAALKAAMRFEEGVKGLIWPSVIFEELGFTYYGPIDGHDLENLIKTFEFLKHHEGPVLLHVITQKNRGFELGIAQQKKYHGVGPGTYKAETLEEVSGGGGGRTYSQVFADTLVKLADMNSRVVAITAAMPNGTALDRFQPKHPDKYFDVGIAEEHAVLFAAGMATKGLKPFCAIYSTFLQRAYDPIVHDVCLQNLNVVFCMDRGGLSGDDGPTHHGLFDISYLRCVPNLVHAVPANEDELADLLFTALHHDGPFAVRYPRGTGPGVAVKDRPKLLDIGKAEVLKHGKDVAIFALGDLIPLAQQTAEEMEKAGYSVAVINARWCKPLDAGTLEFFARSAELIITFEDHVLKGGFGSAVLEELSDRGLRTPVVRIGWPDQFVEHGKVPLLRERYGISVKSALERSSAFLPKLRTHSAERALA
jgi:1-deoxy-D-xylulose-5-phosphate synthase